MLHLNNRRPGRGRLFSALLAAAVAALCAALGAGFLGGLSPILDSFSHVRLHVAALLVVVALAASASGHRRMAVLGALVAAAALAATARYVLPGSALRAAAVIAAPQYTLLQMNILYKTGEVTQALRRIGEARPDIVTLQEMTPEWRAAVGRIADQYPFQFHCEGANGFSGDSAILSRRPFAAGDAGLCDIRNSLARRAVDLNGVAVTIVSQHQLWPWPGHQWERLDRLRPALRTIRGAAIVAGDFNAVPWSASLRAYGEASGTAPVRGIGPTWIPEQLPPWLGRWIGLPIDNILVSDAIIVAGVDRLEATASDHLPVLLRFGVRSPVDPSGGETRSQTVSRPDDGKAPG